MPATRNSIVCVPGVDQFPTYTTLRYTLAEVRRSMVVRYTPSMYTVARPRVAFVGAMIAIARPVKRCRTVAPACREFVIPPLVAGLLAERHHVPR